MKLEKGITVLGAVWCFWRTGSRDLGLTYFAPKELKVSTPREIVRLGRPSEKNFKPNEINRHAVLPRVTKNVSKTNIIHAHKQNHRMNTSESDPTLKQAQGFRKFKRK